MGKKQSQVTILHRLINKERLRHGLRWARWNQDLYRLAKKQANAMARQGQLFHSDRYALQGGECCAGGPGSHSPVALFKSWMKSPRHKAWLLDARVKTAAVAISRSSKGTYAAWTFSSEPLKEKRRNGHSLMSKLFSWLGF